MAGPNAVKNAAGSGARIRGVHLTTASAGTRPSTRTRPGSTVSSPRLHLGSDRQDSLRRPKAWRPLETHSCWRLDHRPSVEARYLAAGAGEAQNPGGPHEHCPGLVM